jgi:hypothetical protein
MVISWPAESWAKVLLVKNRVRVAAVKNLPEIFTKLLKVVMICVVKYVNESKFRENIIIFYIKLLF